MERQYASSFTQTRAVWLSSGKPYANSLPSGVGRERGSFLSLSLSLSPFFNLVKLTTFSQALISASLMGQRPTRELRGWEKNLERERERERERNGSGEPLRCIYLYIRRSRIHRLGFFISRLWIPMERTRTGTLKWRRRRRRRRCLAEEVTEFMAVGSRAHRREKKENRVRGQWKFIKS